MILVADGLIKRYGGVTAVAGVSFALAAGERLALIGPNGAGKTTLFNMLGGHVRPDAGRVSLGGEDVTGLAPRKMFARGVGRTFQITATVGSRTVRENVALALTSAAGRSASVTAEAGTLFAAEAEPLLAAAGIAEAAERPAAELAYGDLKRLELAVALANRPRLLLMDEPTAGMAAAERTAFMAEVSRNAAAGAAVLFTEHDMDVVFGNADRILVLSRGALIAEGPPAAIRADPLVRAVYLGEDGDQPLPPHGDGRGDG